YSSPLSPDSQADRRVWHHDPSGSYAVKSGYKLDYSLTQDCSSSGECSDSNKAIFRVLWGCNLAKQVWYFSSIGASLSGFTGVFFGELCVFAITALSPDDLENTISSPQEILDRASRLLAGLVGADS
ncbi:hypothetical protein TorRG33x02_356300, partial [Trema orientale]